MAQTKPKKVFSLANFRGIDTENKPSKVASFRASDGYNFVIESDVLRTRPAFRFKKEFMSQLNLEENDFIIDWYEYKNIEIYITKKHFYIYDGVNIYNENSDEVIFAFVSEINFDGYEPLFQEEKDCLFIFCIGAIFVFSIIKDLDDNTIAYALYDLKNKPLNPFSLANEELLFETFEKLPTPYEPTLMIGGDSFEDINLLSNTSKYELFSNTNNEVVDGKTTYYLPTNYDPKKHEGFTKTVYAYDGLIDEFTHFPIFLGIKGQNFTDELSVYGEIIGYYDGEIFNETVINVKDKFFAIKDFEYFVSKDETTGEIIVDEVTGEIIINSTIIEEIGLTKKDFFSLRVEENSESIFGYLIDYLRNNKTTLGESNKILKFNVSVVYNAIYKDELDDSILKIVKKESFFEVCVLLKKLEAINTSYAVGTNSQSSLQTVTDNSLPYPTSPTLSETVEENTHKFFYNSPGNTLEEVVPVKLEMVNSENVLDIYKSFLNTKIGLFEDGDIVKVYGKFFSETIVNQDFSLVIPSHNSWLKGIEDNDITWDNETTITDGNGALDYPIFDDEGLNVIEIGLLTTSGETFNFSQGSTQWAMIYNAIESAIINSEAIPLSGQVWVKLKMQTYYLDGGGSVYEKGISLVIKVNYTKEATITYYNRQVYLYQTTITQSASVIADDLYEINFNEKRHAFELKIRDYFYDYQNEPSIKVKIKFDLNPDYDLIANTRFGINFGTENRLFLAGNPDYPNIDRYNVSNDLLGKGERNQSYEFSYFPSKNYRVVGGKGAINGYAVATDSHLYVTKENRVNDNKLFVRSRSLDENGIVKYFEQKTSVNQTPLNHRCIVRFNNDILMLTKNGLYAIELSQNVLTDERLIKLRSGLVNKELQELLKNYENAFIIENNEYMYLFIDDRAYILNSKYLTKSEDALGDIFYEVVKWSLPEKYSFGKIVDNEPILLSEEKNYIVELYPNDKDQNATINKYSLFDALIKDGYTIKSFNVPYDFYYIFDDYKTYSFMINVDVFRLYASKNVDYVSVSPEETYYVEGLKRIINIDAFKDMYDGKQMYYYSSSEYIPFEISGFDGEFFILPSDIDALYENLKGTELYIDFMYKNLSGDVGFRLSKVLKEDVLMIEQQSAETNDTFLARVLSIIENSDNKNNFLFPSPSLLGYDLIVIKNVLIDLTWLSGITNFGSPLMEKTLFRTVVNVTKQSNDNIIEFGYKTMRRLKSLEETEGLTISSKKEIDLSGIFNFEDFNFKLYSFSTFNEVGLSIPSKENNFLNIQFFVHASGMIELNSLLFIYKINRQLKTIG